MWLVDLIGNIDFRYVERAFTNTVAYVSNQFGLEVPTAFRIVVGLISTSFYLLLTFGTTLFFHLLNLFTKLITLPFRWMWRYPQTEFGFAGQLVYTDDSPQAKTFVHQGYELSGKPDFIFKVGFNQYVIVEYKSRQGTVRLSDILQLLACAIACRSKYNVVRGYVITGKQTKVVQLGTNRSIYKRIKATHKLVRKIKLHNYFPAKNCDGRCQNCGYQEVCNQDMKFKKVEGF